MMNRHLNPEATSALPSLIDQARRSCSDAARRLEEAQRALDELLAREQSGVEVDLARRAAELAHFRVAAARLAWFNAVVHAERMKARVKPGSDAGFD